MINNWYVVTGGPSSGKTTLVNELKKHGYEIVPEAARILIDSAAEKNISSRELRTNEKRFQEDVAKLKLEVESKTDRLKITFFDRGMPDTSAYLLYYGFSIEPWLRSLINNSIYRKVFLLERLPSYTQDYARTEDKAFVEKINNLLRTEYERMGITVVDVPAMPVQDRVKLIINHIS